MFWKHLKETLRDPQTWRDVSKDLIKDTIKYILKGGVLLVVTFWIGSKLNATLADAWSNVTGAFGPAWQSLWKPLGVPRLLVAITLVFAAVPLVRWWRQRGKVSVGPRLVVQVVQPQPAGDLRPKRAKPAPARSALRSLEEQKPMQPAPAEGPPPLPKLVYADSVPAPREPLDLPPGPKPLELTEKHRRALSVLLREYPNRMARNDLIRMMAGEFRPNERVLLQLQEHDLVRIVPNPWHGVQIVLLPEGADFCEAQGIRPA